MLKETLFLNDDIPLVSVIIPTYNRLLLLQESIASVVAQTYTNWELIIVDDGSTDGTADTIRRMNDPRIRVIAVSHKGNVAALRNIGAERSNGEWLAFQDSDDLWLPRKLELQIDTLKKDKRRWGYGELELMDDNKKTIERKTKHAPLAGWVTAGILTNQTEITIIALIIHRKLFDEVKGFNTDPGLFCREDHELILRTSLIAELSVVPETLVRVRMHANRTTSVFDDAYERSALVYKTFADRRPGKEFEKLAYRQWAFQLSEASVRRFARGHYRIAIKQLWQSLWHGDNKRHWLSTLKRGIYAAFKKHPQPSAEKGKAGDAAAYHT